MSDSNFFSKYLNNCDFLSDKDQAKVSSRLETRTRAHDVTDALRFRVHDPLWMLSRQWQMGEFRGNDAGTAMGVRCDIKYMDANSTIYQMKNGGQFSVPAETPIEPAVEAINREITPLVRVESALFFMDLVYEFGAIKEPRQLLGRLRDSDLFVLKEDDLSSGLSSIETPDVVGFTQSRNTRLSKFRRTSSGKIFDGYKLYEYLNKNRTVFEVPESLCRKYVRWFKERYLPAGTGHGIWETKSLGYGFSLPSQAGEYVADNYPGGRVSWYSFDVKECSSPTRFKNESVLSLPTLASYPGAPKKRLWEFEDNKVFMGNSKDMQAKGNVAFMQYATMYGNDWMLCPLTVPVGTFIQVEKITVFDTFGRETVITRRAGEKDTGAKTFGQKWQMFTNAPVNQISSSSQSAPGLFFPPSLIRVLEGEPVEEVCIIRDEMANMVWGVETKVSDGCGSSMDAILLASEVGQYVDEEYDKAVKKARYTVKNDALGNTSVESNRVSDYKYKLMTTVPFNWIPFLPQHINDSNEKKLYSGFLGGREVILRRGKMPYFHDGEYRAVRPLSSILKVEMVKTPEGKTGEKPLFIDEEQVQGVGTLIKKNCQRARWIGGKTYTWMGYSKQIKQTQGVSGLEYDNLVSPTK